MKNITDPTFIYTPAVSTDIRKTFAKARRRITQEQERKAELDAKVQPIRRVAK